MNRGTVWIQEMTFEDVAEYLTRDDTVIVPIGSCEGSIPGSGVKGAGG